MKLLILALIGLWALLHMKTSRSDGDLIPGLHAYRRMMSYIMATGNSAVVYFDGYVNAAPLLAYLDELPDEIDADVSHCLIAAAFVCFSEAPTMNRFSIGRRLYQRRGVYITFSMKRKQLDREAKLATVKLRLERGETFAALVERINAKVNVERSGTKTYADKEFNLFEHIPRPLLRGAVAALKTLDYFNLLPASFIENDSLYTSMVCANLGSLNMGAGYHHLYDWGNCPAFMMAGKIEDRPVAVDGKVVVQPTLHMRWSYDERIDDGLNARFGIESLLRALANPYEYFGCLAEDGSDRRPLDTPPSAA